RSGALPVRRASRSRRPPSPSSARLTSPVASSGMAGLIERSRAILRRLEPRLPRPLLGQALDSRPMSLPPAFSPATRAWFEASFAAPTPVQAQGWARIAAGEHALLLAPTGSGKTLAAFLWCIDRLSDPANAP